MADVRDVVTPTLDIRDVVAVSLRYSPDQPRDDHGRWTSDGGGDETGSLSVDRLGGNSPLSADQHAEIQQAVDDATLRHPELISGVHPLTAVEFTSNPVEHDDLREMVARNDAQAATEVSGEDEMRILINDNAGWMPVEHQSAYEVMTHELGHAYFAEHGVASPSASGAVLKEHDFTPEQVKEATNSQYATVDAREGLAELYRVANTTGLPTSGGLDGKFAELMRDVGSRPYTPYIPFRPPV